MRLGDNIEGRAFGTLHELLTVGLPSEQPQVYYPTLDAYKDMVRRCGDDMPYDMAYHVKLVAKMLTGNKELSNELDRRQDGHATLAVARILSSVDKALKGGTAMVLSLVSASAGEMAEMTRYMSQVDFVFSQTPAIVAAYRPRAIHFLSWTVCILHPFEGSTRTIRSETRGERRPTAPALCQWYTWPWSECPWQLQCSWCSGKMRQGCARWCRSWVRARAPWTLISILYLVIPKHHWFNNWLLLSNIIVS